MFFVMFNEFRRLFYRLINSIVGPELASFSRSMCNASPAKVGEIEIDFREGLEHTAIIQEMLDSFKESCPFYRLDWYVQRLSL